MDKSIENKNHLNDLTRFKYLDSIKGFAILGVILFHVSIHIVGLTPIFKDILNIGNYGVQLFFITSALTLFMSCYSRFTKEEKPIIFFSIRRLFRIAPMFWLAIIFYQFFHAAPGHIFLASNAKPWHVVFTALFIHGWHPATINNIVPGGWAVAAEMIFYLFVPLFYKYLKNLKSSIITAFVTIIFSLILGKILNIYLRPILQTLNYNSYQIQTYFYYLFPRQLPVFIFGFVTFFLIKKNTNLKDLEIFSFNSGKIIFFIGILIFLFVVFFQKIIIADFLIISIGYIFIIWGLSIYPVPFFCNKYISYLGKISFSAYLIHFAIISIILKNKIWISHISPLNPTLSFFITFLIVTILTIIFSSITYQLIEINGQNIGKKLINYLNKE